MQCWGMESPPARGVAVPAQADLDPTFVVPIPLQDQVLIRRRPPVSKIGSVLLPESARSKPKQGVVLSVGPGRILESGGRSEMELKPGDVVYYSPYAGLNLEEISREDGFLVMTEEDVKCRDPRPGEKHLTAQRKA